MYGPILMNLSLQSWKLCTVLLVKSPVQISSFHLWNVDIQSTIICLFSWQEQVEYYIFFYPVMLAFPPSCKESKGKIKVVFVFGLDGSDFSIIFVKC